jgi:glutathione S-transferase
MAQIMSIIDSYTYSCTVGDLVIQRLVTPMLGGTADESVIEAALPKIDKCMGELEKLLGDQQYLTGSALSLADLHLAPIFSYFVDTPESQVILENKAGLSAWWQRMAARDSMANTQPQLG